MEMATLFLKKERGKRWTTDGDLFTCNGFHAWVENVYMKGTNY